MIRKLALLTLTAAMSSATAGTLPDSKPFTTPVSLNAPLGGLPLDAALDSIIRAAGLTPVMTGVPTTSVKLSFNKKPFKDVFTTLVNVYGGGTLDFKLLNNNMLVVAPAETIQKTTANLSAPVKAAAGTSPVSVTDPVIIKLYAVQSDAAEVTAVLNTFFPDARVAALGKTVMVGASAGTQKDIAALITSVDAAVKDKVAAAQPAPLPTTPVATAEPVKPVKPVRKFYPVVGNVDEVRRVIGAFYPDLALTTIESTKQLIVELPEELIAPFEELLGKVNAQRSEPAAEVGETVLMTYTIIGDSKEILATLQRFMPGMEISLMEKTGALVARGTPDEQMKLLNLLTMINVPVSEERVERDPTAVQQQVFRLSNGKAADIVAAVTKILSASAAATAPAAATATPSSQLPMPGAAPSLPTAAASTKLEMVADDRTNAIVAVGTRAQLNELETTIKYLDVPLPQVLLKVRVEQVKEGSSRDLGVEWKGSVGGLTLGLAEGAVNLGYSPTGTLAPFDLGLKLNMLNSQGNSKTILNTTLMAQDNQKTKLNSGGSLMLPVLSSNAQGNSTSMKYESYDYGLGVELTPRIGANGNINLDLNTTIGNKPQAGPGGGVVFEKQDLTSKISLKPGESVVLGGLIQQDENASNKGVPFLSELPLVGSLFRTTNTSRSNSVLLFIITAEPVSGAATPAAPAQAAATPPVTPKTAAPSGNGTQSVTIPKRP